MLLTRSSQLLPPLHPQVCSLCLCLHCCPANRFISANFLDSIGIDTSKSISSWNDLFLLLPGHSRLLNPLLSLFWFLLLYLPLSCCYPSGFQPHPASFSLYTLSPCDFIYLSNTSYCLLTTYYVLNMLLLLLLLLLSRFSRVCVTP